MNQSLGLEKHSNYAGAPAGLRQTSLKVLRLRRHSCPNVRWAVNIDIEVTNKDERGHLKWIGDEPTNQSIFVKYVDT